MAFKISDFVPWKFIILIYLWKEVDMFPNTVINDISVKDLSPCEDGWKPYDQHCFKLFDTALNWTDASKDCKSKGGHLASIHSKEQNDFMETFCTERRWIPVWIGLRDHDLDGIFVWHDESDVTYTNWNPGEPVGNYTSGDCVELNLGESGVYQCGKWIVYECNVYNSYLCQRKTASYTVISSSTVSEIIDMLPNTVVNDVSVKDKSSCEEGWKPYDQYCFKLFTSSLDWMNSSNECKSMGGHLASIHSEEQNDFMQTFYTEGRLDMTWIGLRDHDLDGKFVWHDESEVTYTNWNPGEPYGNYTTGDCVVLNPSKYHFFEFKKWLVYDCQNKFFYLCQKKFATSAITSSIMDSETSFISVTAPVITVLTIFVFLALMGGIVYYKRHWLEEKRVKIFYRRAEGPTTTEPYTKLVLEPK